jgi:hypothetical protein
MAQVGTPAGRRASAQEAEAARQDFDSLRLLFAVPFSPNPAEDEAARSTVGHNAREWALRNLGWDSRVSQYERLYRSLLTSRAR